jgi:Rrf2 family protein
MSSNTHFALAIHILACLAVWPEEPIPSAAIAASVGTHPAFLRELLGRLRSAGLVENRMGKGGGSLLARSPEQITLRDVYQAVEAGPSVTMHHSTPSHCCAVGQNILPVLTGVMEKVDEAVSETLTRMTLADIVAQIRQCG